MEKGLLTKPELRKFLRFRNDVKDNAKFLKEAKAYIDKAYWDAYLAARHLKKGRFLTNAEHKACIYVATDAITSMFLDDGR